jgi:hypothetical protein
MKARASLAAAGIAAIAMALASVPADAKGCIKGAVVGGAAGHHGWLGAAAGCIIGHHEAKKRERMQRQTDNPNPERM